MRRRRPRTSLALSGRAVHSGQWGVARIEPARWGTGLRVARGSRSWPVAPAAVSPQPGCTRIGDVATVEHALAALVLLGITDATLVMEGSEVPILDGSAAPWVRALLRVGVEAGPPRRVADSRPCEVRAAGGLARWTPGPVDSVTVHVAFEGGPHGSATHPLADTPAEALITARTFARGRDLPALRRAGRGRGADPTNTVLVRKGDAAPLAIQHLLLDAIGDRALGGSVRGHAELWRPSHALSRALWSEVLREHAA